MGCAAHHETITNAASIARLGPHGTTDAWECKRSVWTRTQCLSERWSMPMQACYVVSLAFRNRHCGATVRYRMSARNELLSVTLSNVRNTAKRLRAMTVGAA